MNIEHLLVNQCELQRNKVVALGGGSFRNAYTAYATDVPCRRSPLSGNDLVAAEQRKAIATHAFYFLPGVGVKVEDRVVLDGVSYRVTVDLPPSLPYHSKVLVEELKLAPAAVVVTGTAEVL